MHRPGLHGATARPLGLPSTLLLDSLLLTTRVQLLIGLDLMRKYQAVVDLGRNAMLIGGKAIPFVEGDDKKRH